MGEAVVVDLETGEVLDTVETAPAMTPDDILSTLRSIDMALGLDVDDEDDNEDE